jgi:transposase
VHIHPEQIEQAVRRHSGDEARSGIEPGPMTPWLVHELRGRGLGVTCLDSTHARAALKMQINKTDQNDAEGLAQMMRSACASDQMLQRIRPTAERTVTPGAATEANRR